MPTYSLEQKQQILEQLISRHSTIEQLMERYGISRNTLFRWQAQYRLSAQKLNGSASLTIPASKTNTQSTSPSYWHSSIVNSQEMLHFTSPKASAPQLSEQESTSTKAKAATPETQSQIATATAASKEQALSPEPPTELIVSLLQVIESALSAKASLWHGAKCDQLCCNLGMDVEQLRALYESIRTQGIVSSSRYSLLEQQVLQAQTQIAQLEHKIAILEAKEQLYQFYLAQFKRQSVLYKLDFASLNDQLKQEFLKLIENLQNSGMSTQEAAELIGINVRTYYRWLKNATDAQSSSLQLPKIASSLPTDELHSSPLQASLRRSNYKLISADEIELLKELLFLPEYHGLNIRDCYSKLQQENLITMSLGSFYRHINKEPALKALFSKTKS